MGAGHASTSIGYAVGLKEGMRRRGETDAGKVVAVIGDGAMTGGVAFEAIHQAGGLGTPIVVVLNDNGMSIAPNVGALSRYFNRVRLNPKLWHAREGVEERPHRAARRHRRRVRAPRPAAQGVDQGVLGARACSGRSSTGPTWASSTATTSRALRARAARGARRRAARRRPHRDGQGQGLRARPRTAAWRAWRSGTPPSRSRSPTARPRRQAAAGKTPNARAAAVHEGLRRGARRARRGATARVVGITAAMNSGTGLNILQKAMPERYFDVGIAEQQAILFAAGLALEGVKPVAAIYSTFLQRAFDQIVHDVCLQKPRTSSSRWTAPASSATTARRTTASSTSPTCAACRTSSLMAPRDEAMLVHMLRTALLYDDGPVAPALPARRGDRRRRCRRRPARRSRSAPARSCARARQVALARLRHRRREGAGGRRPARRRAGIDVTVADARFAKPLDAALLAAARRRARAARHRRGGRARRRLRLGGAGRR